MPELPEVETARKLAARTLAGRRLVGVATVDDPIVYAGVSPRRLAAALRGRRGTAGGRQGKHLWLELGRPPRPPVHFGLSGAFRGFRPPAPRPRLLELGAQNRGRARPSPPAPP